MLIRKPACQHCLENDFCADTAMRSIARSNYFLLIIAPLVGSINIAQ